MASLNHVHKYQRKDIGKGATRTKKVYVVYRCMLPGCSHYVPENQIEGRESVCWGCSKVLIVKAKHGWIREKPLCNTCRELRPNGPQNAPARRKETQVEAKVKEDFLDTLFGSIKLPAG